MVAGGPLSGSRAMTAASRFTHAITRTPAPSAVRGLRAGDGPDPDFAALLADHSAYVAALRQCGLTVTILPPLDDFPDALFVEDVALTFPEGAILLRPGAPSRAGEVAHIADALAAEHGTLLAMAGPGHVDGGDVLRQADRVQIGLSRRTDRAGADELAVLLAQLGYRAEIVATPPGMLHFKTGCSLVDDATILVIPELAASDRFADLSVLTTPDGERGAANVLRINDHLLVNAQYPATLAMLQSLGLSCIALDTVQIARIDAGLSCMSLRW
jgi:dimethylargininase